MSQADAPAADWYPDPSGRFQFRYWDGEAWTGHVSIDGKTDWDPPGDAAPEVEQQPAEEPAQVEPAAQPSAAGDADATWAPQAAQPEAAQPEAAQPEAAQPEPTQPEPAQPEAAQPASQPASSVGLAKPAEEPVQHAQGGTIEEGEPSDTNLVANQRAGLDDDVEEWLDQVAGQVEPRLSRIEGSWTGQPQAEAARACAYGLLIGHLAHLHPHMRPDLSLVAESHPSFTTLEAGARLDTLEQIARDPQRTAAWLGPLIGNEDVDRVKMLFD